MKTIKANFGTIVKLWINQIGSMLFAAFLLLPADILAEKTHQAWILPLASALAAAFYLTLIFWVTCELGLHDSVPIDAGRMKMKWYKGTLLSVFANALAIAAATVQSILKIFVAIYVPDVKYLGTTSHARGALVAVYTVFWRVNEILHIMYQGLLATFGWLNTPFIYLIVIFLSVVTCTAGYVAGTKGFLANLLSKDAKKRDRG